MKTCGAVPQKAANFLKILVLTAFLTTPTAIGQQPTAGKATGTFALTRPVRSWEFLPAVGQRAAFYGEEDGRMEAWVYPLKLLRDLHLVFHLGGEALVADPLARSIEVRPESASILYAGNDFSVRETFFVPVQESGALILLEVDTEEPLEVEVAFQSDFQLEWPGAFGGSDEEISTDGRSFVLTAESQPFAAIVGSPTASNLHAEFETNYNQDWRSSLRLGITQKGKETKIVALAGSTLSYEDAAKTYQKLTSSWDELLQQSARYYRDYLERTVSVEIPDAQLQQAYDWARVSVIQGLVANPKLGDGLIAGYRPSGHSLRPGFAWFFGRDSFWTALALDASGDLTTSRAALEFVGKFQRADGKIPHEISQSAGYVDWFKDFPFAYASADATPLYVIAMDDYYRHSGDSALVKEKWESIWKAYQFLRSTWDEGSFPKNQGVGHGWVEGGPLLPVKTELYQTALGAEALRAVADLARATGDEQAGAELDQLFAKQKVQLNQTFWLEDKNRYAFALDQNDHPVDELSVLSTVPMWFGILDENKAEKTISQLAAEEHQTDWGMRIISIRSPKFNGGGYHFGSVWPLFTGWAAVGEYRYHRTEPAEANLRSNALLIFDGSLGHVTEVLSGSEYAQLATSSPHQIWSAAMVVSPVLRGMFGIEADAVAHMLKFVPHAPATWPNFAVHNVPVAAAALDLRYRKTTGEVTLEVTQKGGGETTLDFEPALSLRAKVLGVEVNGRAAAFRVDANEVDQHAVVHVALRQGTTMIRIRVKNDFGVSYETVLPKLGENSSGLRILGEVWSADRNSLTLEVSGRAGKVYELSLWNGQQVRSAEGASMNEAAGTGSAARVQIPGSDDAGYQTAKVVFHF